MAKAILKRFDGPLFFPDFRKNTILNIGRALRGDDVPEIFELGENALIFLLDGVGYSMLPHISQQLADLFVPISSILPTNTVVAVPALLSGELPTKFGYFGPFHRENGKFVDLFKVGVHLPLPELTYILPDYLIHRAFGRSVPGKVVPYINHIDLARFARLVKGRGFVYIPQTDSIIHRYGPKDYFSLKTVEFWLKVIANAVRDYKGDVIVVSDHGITQTTHQIPLVSLGYSRDDIMGDFRLLLVNRYVEGMNAYKLTRDLCLKLFGVQKCPMRYAVIPKDGTTYYPPGYEQLMGKTAGGMHGGARGEEILVYLLEGEGKRTV